MKNKNIAGIFALSMGVFGLHKFYLGERKMGKLYMVATFLLFFMSVKVNVPLVVIMGLVSLIDAILLFSMDREEFNEKYNQRFLNHRSYASQLVNRQQIAQPTAVAPPEQANPWKAAGIQKFKEFDYDGALEDFKRSLSVKFDDAAVHFNLACCYSLNERPDPAFFHLTKAVHFGFVDFDKIEKHEGLAFLRTQPAFSDFIKKGYQLHSAQPAEPAKDLLSQAPSSPKQAGPTLLEQIKRLSELREQGILTEEEYKGMKEEVLRK